MVAASTTFPALAWLGFSLDMTAVTPFDTESVKAAVLTAQELIVPSQSTHNKTVGPTSWTNIPDNVWVTSDTVESETNEASWSTGNEAYSDFTTDSSLKAKYLSVEGGLSIDYSLKKSFSDSKQVFFYSIVQRTLLVEFINYQKDINVEFLKNQLKFLAPWNPDEEGTVRSYTTFFAEFGTHVIVGCSYGSLTALNLQASNSNADVNKNFRADVYAKYQGLVSSGQFDTKISGESQYREFSNNAQKYVNCLGGDINLSARIESAPESNDSYATFLAWVETANQNPNVMSMRTQALWAVMNGTNDSYLHQRSEEVEKAYYHLIAKPAEGNTSSTLYITSDIGGFDMLTPLARVAPDPTSALDLEIQAQVKFTDTSVKWFSGQHGKFGSEVKIPFIIINDGSPVDFVLCHGSDGYRARDAKGAATAIIGHRPYKNTDIVPGSKDDYPNPHTYYHIPLTDVSDNTNITKKIFPPNLGGSNTSVNGTNKIESLPFGTS